jgi:hypothetical protein
MPTPEEAQIAAELGQQFPDSELASVGVREGTPQYPKGGYDLRITNAYLDKTGKGIKFLAMECTILASDQGEANVGKNYVKKFNLETQENFQWLNDALVNMDLAKISKAADLLERTQQLAGICFHASFDDAKDTAFWQPCYINRGARRSDLEGAAAGGKRY